VHDYVRAHSLKKSEMSNI